ncbi:MAG: hypothetical protein WA626_14835 [Acidobacteriaceae bacterium]
MVYQIARLSRNSRPQTQIGIRMGICMLWRQGFIPPWRLSDPGNECQADAKDGGTGGTMEASMWRRQGFLGDIVFNVIPIRRTFFL